MTERGRPRPHWMVDMGRGNYRGGREERGDKIILN